MCFQYRRKPPSYDGNRLHRGNKRAYRHDTAKSRTTASSFMMAQGCAFCSVGDCYPCLFVSDCLTVPGWATRFPAACGERGCGLVSDFSCRLQWLRVWFDRRNCSAAAMVAGGVVCKRLLAETVKRSTYAVCLRTPPPAVVAVMVGLHPLVSGNGQTVDLRGLLAYASCERVA